MIKAFIAAATIASILLVGEVLWRKSKLKGEFARKFTHIAAGTCIAFLPFYLDYGWVMLFGLGFVLANLLNRYTKTFKSIHAVKRHSVGDLMFGLAVMVCAYLSPPEWIFAAAILHVSLADGLAAVVGSKFGKTSYKVFGFKKTILGTSIFLLTSLLIFSLVIFIGNLDQADVASLGLLLLMGPAITALVENISPYGLDNLTLPITVLALFEVIGTKTILF